MSARRFHLGDLLSVTTERLVSPEHLDGFYNILGYMTGEDLFTHQLSRANDLCKPALLAQHPQLAAIEVPDFSGFPRETIGAAVAGWVAEQVAIYGEWLEVEPLPPSAAFAGDPIAELEDMVGKDRVITVAIEDGDDD